METGITKLINENGSRHGKSYISSNLSRCKSGRIFLTTATV